MHEMALMGDILLLIEKDLEKRNLDRVKRIDLIIGELSNVLPDAIELAFDVYKAQGIPFIDNDSQLTIIREKAKAKCLSCDVEYEPDQRLAICPVCQFPSGQLISGETFRIESYEGE